MGYETVALQKFGPFGRYNSVVTISTAATTLFNTTSSMGAAALMIGEASATGTITLASGGDIDLSLLTVGTLYELGVSKIVTGTTKKIYVFKR